MLNHITLMGRLVADPELRRTTNGTPVASFRIACDRDFSGKGEEKKCDFFSCVAWRHTGEFISKYFTKGRMIVIDGRLENRDWNDKDGNKRTSTEIIVENAYFGDSKKDGDGAPANGGNSYGGNGGYNAPANGNGGNNYGGASNYGGNNYGGAPNYGGNTYGGAPNYGGNTYAAPAGGPASDFAMLDDDDAQLPF